MSVIQTSTLDQELYNRALRCGCSTCSTIRSLLDRIARLEAENAALKAPLSEEEKKAQVVWDGADTLMFDEIIAARVAGKDSADGR